MKRSGVQSGGAEIAIACNNLFTADLCCIICQWGGGGGGGGFMYHYPNAIVSSLCGLKGLEPCMHWQNMIMTAHVHYCWDYSLVND